MGNKMLQHRKSLFDFYSKYIRRLLFISPQKVALFGVVSIGILVSLGITDYYSLISFKSGLKLAEQQNIIDHVVISRIVSIIKNSQFNSNLAFLPIFIGWILLVLGVMHWVSRRNWSKKINLSKAIEFRAAMDKLGINDPVDRVSFCHKHNLPIFIATTPLIKSEQENVPAKQFPLLYHQHFFQSNFFEQCIGRQVLCIEANDFYQVKEKNESTVGLSSSPKIVQLETDIKKLEITNDELMKKYHTVKEERDTLVFENASLKAKLQTQSAREQKNINKEQNRVVFWRVGGPCLNKMIEKAEQQPLKYSRRQIQENFEEELDNHQELKADIQRLLSTNKKIEESTPYSLDGWAMGLLRYGLGKYAQNSPGAPTKEE